MTQSMEQGHCSRLMQKEIDDRLANLLLAGEITDGSFVKVDVDTGAEALRVSVK